MEDVSAVVINVLLVVDASVVITGLVHSSEVTAVEIVGVRIEAGAVSCDVMRVLVGTVLLFDSAVVVISVVVSVVIWVAIEVVSVITVVIRVDGSAMTVGLVDASEVTAVEIVDVRVEVVAVPSDVMRLLVGTMLLVDSAVVEISVVASVVIWVATEVVSVDHSSVIRVEWPLSSDGMRVLTVTVGSGWRQKLFQ